MSDLQNIKAGDVVTLQGGAPRVTQYIKRVKRTTKTQIVVELKNMVGTVYERKFMRSTGDEVGCAGQWSRCFITATTEADRNYLRKKRWENAVRAHLKVLIDNIDQHKLATPALEDIAARLSIDPPSLGGIL